MSGLRTSYRVTTRSWQEIEWLRERRHRRDELREWEREHQAELHRDRLRAVAAQPIPSREQWLVQYPPPGTLFPRVMSLSGSSRLTVIHDGLEMCLPVEDVSLEDCYVNMLARVAGVWDPYDVNSPFVPYATDDKVRAWVSWIFREGVEHNAGNLLHAHNLAVIRGGTLLP